LCLRCAIAARGERNGRRVPEEERRTGHDATDSLSTLLALQGHTLAVAYISQDAIQRAEAFLPDVALLDIGLPCISGYELAQKNPRHPAASLWRLVAIAGDCQPKTISAPTLPVSTIIWSNRCSNRLCNELSPQCGARRASEAVRGVFRWCGFPDDVPG